MKQITVKQDENTPVATEVLATEIVAISAGIKKLRAGRLTDRALFLLIQHAAPTVGKYNASKVGIAEIKAVLEGMESLEATFLKKRVSKL